MTISIDWPLQLIFLCTFTRCVTGVNYFSFGEEHTISKILKLDLQVFFLVAMQP
jgi:hypothetical protein